jgi:hypothetical protein
MDAAKNIPKAIDNAKVNQQLKNIDKAYDSMKTNMFPSVKSDTPTNILKPYEPKPRVKPKTLENTFTLKNRAEEEALKRLEEGIEQAQNYFGTNKISSKVQPTTLNKKLTFKNKVAENAYAKLKEAIEQAQNYFGTNELRVGELDEFKRNTGIDLMKLADDYAKAESKTKNQVLNEIIESSRYKRVSGLSPERTYQTLENIIRQGDMPTSEFNRFTQDTGIDLTKLVDDYAQVSGKTNQEVLNEIAEMSRMKRVTGLGSDSTYKVLDTVAKQGDVPQTINIGGEKFEITKPINRIEPIKKIEPLKKIEPPNKISNASDAEKLYAVNPLLRPKFNSPINDNVQFTTPDTSTKIVNTKDAKVKSNLNTFEKMYSKLVDNQYAIEKFAKNADSEKVKIMASNSRNVPGTVSYILKDGLVDKSGKEIGGSFKNIIDRVPKSQETAFNDYLLNRHNVYRMNEGKPVFGENITSDISLKRIAEYEAKYPEFKQTAEMYDKFMNDFMETWGVKSGLISEDTWKVLKEKYPHYVPTYRVLEEVLGPKPLNAKRAFVNQPNIVKKATGSSKPVINPLEKSMELVDKTVKAAKYNEVGQTIVDEIRKNPDKLRIWAELIEEPADMQMPKGLDIEEVMEEFNKQYDSIFKKEKLNAPNVVRVMENGKPVYLKINDKDFFEAVTGLTRSKPSDLEKIAKYITTPFKSLITTKNPVFAVRNLARDIPTAYINGSEMNPVKFVMGLMDAAKDMKNNSEMFKEYKALGGGESDFLKSDLKKLYRKDGPISTFNNFIESIPRYAEYKRSVIKGGNTFEAKMKALYNANEVTTNFARSGNITKSVDSLVPYLNASVQGLDKMIRQAVKNPFGTVGKGVVIVTVPAVGLYFVNKDNPYYHELDNRTKDNYFIIPNFQDKDSQGIPKTFIKIPKSREYGVMLGALFERALRAKQGEKNAFKGFGKQVTLNLAPNNPLENNIFSPIITNLPSNKDFAGRTIVPYSLSGRSPRYQYDDQTTEIAKFLGDKFNFSPKQIDYLIDAYTGIVGDMVIAATKKSTYAGDNVKDKILRPITSQFKSDPLYSNDIVNTFYEYKNKIDTEKQDSKITGKNDYAKLSKKFNKYYDKISDLYKKIRATTDDEEIKILRRQILEIAKEANEFFESNTN